MGRVFSGFFAIFGVALGLSHQNSQADEMTLYRVSDSTEVTLSRALGDLRGARLVFVGEFHEKKSHHKMQLTVIRTPHEAAIPLAVGLEMFRQDCQSELNRWIAGKLSKRDFQRLYFDNWNYPWRL